jgi:hypothetical protein
VSRSEKLADRGADGSVLDAINVGLAGIAFDFLLLIILAPIVEPFLQSFGLPLRFLGFGALG